MDKDGIIGELAQKKTIEEIITNIKGVFTEDEQELAQDLYLDLMSKEEDLIQKLYEEKSLKFFVARMVCNQINSVNSPYYYKYRRYVLLKSPLATIKGTKYEKDGE